MATAFRLRACRSGFACGFFAHVLVAALVLAVLSTAIRAEDDENDTIPGLVGTYRAGRTTVRRVDRDIAFDWKTDAPDPRLARGPFSVRWSGQLLVREATPFRLHAFLQGSVSVTVDGRTVLAGRRDGPGWISGDPIEVGLGEKPLAVQFDSSDKGAILKLFWSSARFPLEPLPAYLLFSNASAIPKRKELAQIERGRRDFEVARCIRCHHRSEFYSLAAPSLTHVADGLSRSAIVDKVARHAPRPTGEQMPTFDLTRDEATAIAAFLIHDAIPAVLEEAPDVSNVAKEARKGETHVCSLGCLACHTVPGRKPRSVLGNAGGYGGGDLSAIGSKRSVDWLWTWLAKPDALNADHRMPVFNIKKKERRQIVSYLSTLKNPQDKPKTKTPSDRTENEQPIVERGRALVAQARCAACHEIKDVHAEIASLPNLSRPVGDWNHSCLAGKPDRGRFRPSFPQVDRTAVIAYVNAHAGIVSDEAEIVRGERLLERKQCVACHARGGYSGLGSTAAAIVRSKGSLRATAESLIPPNLTAVGDKLKDEALAEAVNGGMKKRRLPWLTVRMPRFQHSDQERSALLAAFVSHDRIPDDAPESAATRSDAAQARAAADSNEESRVVAGQRLVGPSGFSCTACHDMGAYAPKNVAIPTHGSDLMGIGRRMRREFFLRWTRAPLRIRPGMEMPSYERPVAGLLHGEIALQLAALWEALNDPRFTPQINPSAVEQFLVVRPGEPARIVRDVFAKRKGGNGPVARAFAVGFNNGHSLLFDLDLFSLRDWTVGDFARQRTSGKSWFWDLAGTPVTDEFEPLPGLALAGKDESRDAPILPKREVGSVGQLMTYRRLGDGVELTYKVNFDLDGVTRSIEVRETLVPLPAREAKPAGFRRRIEIVRGIDGRRVLLRVPKARFLLSGASIDPTYGAAVLGAGQQAVQGWTDFRTQTSAGKSIPETSLEYRCGNHTTPAQFEPPQAPKLVPETVDCVPGFDGVRLPLDRSIMPTGIAWTSDGNLVFTSLKGHVYRARDTDGDGVEDRLEVVEEGLAAPYGLLADGHDLIVAHKPELLRLRDTDGDGRVDLRSVLATGWGYSENYHDWTCGLVRDGRSFFYVGLGSDYSQKNRSLETSRWRGKVLRIDAAGHVTPIAHAFRYPTGLAFDSEGRLFATDNQGDQNPFNELNHIVEGGHYGVPSLHEEDLNAPTMPPAIQIPHPWTRSVNGICFLPNSAEGKKRFGPLAGQGIGCEYNGRFLVRFTLQEVDGTVQGAVYPFSQPPEDRLTSPGASRSADAAVHGFAGPLCCAVSPGGDLFIGEIQDSGWMGGANVGDLVRLRPNGTLSNGLREIRATPQGFELTFFQPVDRNVAQEPSSYSLIGYTRVWRGGYATPDSGRHRVTLRQCTASPDGLRVTLVSDRLREGYVYEVSTAAIGTTPHQAFWPRTGYYTLHHIPKEGHASASSMGGPLQRGERLPK
jgi:mono/diheme cytochrome c family protein/glucose/arabinose dehydrogenase